MAFDWIVPINTTAADTKDPGFYLGVYSIVSVCLSYIFFAFIATSGGKIVMSPTFYKSKWDLGLSVTFGLIVFLVMFGWAWGGYINIVLYNYAPGSGTQPGIYRIELTQDFYAIGLTSIGVWYGLWMYIYRFYNYGYAKDTDIKAEKIPSTRAEYTLRCFFPMLAYTAWVILPGSLAYKSNGALFNAGSWMVLLCTILLGVYVAGLFYFAVQNGKEDKILPNVLTLVMNNNNPEEPKVTGHLIGFRTELIFLLSYMFYVTAAEMMIYGDPIKVSASWFVGFYLCGIMAALAKNRATFFAFHVVTKTYFFMFNYWLEYVRTPITKGDAGSTTIDKNIVDICSFTTGPMYSSMNTYLTSFQLFAGLGFGFACATSFIILMVGGAYDEQKARKFAKIAGETDNVLTVGAHKSRQQPETEQKTPGDFLN